MRNKERILSSFILILCAFNSLSSPSPQPASSFFKPHHQHTALRPTTTNTTRHLTPLPNFLHPLSCPWTRMRLMQSICVSSSWLCCFRWPNGGKNPKSLPAPHRRLLTPCHLHWCVLPVVPLVPPHPRVPAPMQPHVCANYSEALSYSWTRASFQASRFVSVHF